MATFFSIQGPNDFLDYTIDWSQWLVGTDTLSTSTWTCTDTIITLTNTTLGTATTIIWVSGGIQGQVYNVTNHVVTAAGRIEERSIQFTINEG